MVREALVGDHSGLVGGTGAVSTRIDTLGAFYRGGIAGYLDILFFPMTALMVLSIGYVRERLDSFVGQSAW